MVTIYENTINNRGCTSGVCLLPVSFAGTPIALVELDNVAGAPIALVEPKFKNKNKNFAGTPNALVEFRGCEYIKSFDVISTFREFCSLYDAFCEVPKQFYMTEFCSVCGSVTLCIEYTRDIFKYRPGCEHCHTLWGSQSSLPLVEDEFSWFSQSGEESFFGRHPDNLLNLERLPNESLYEFEQRKNSSMAGMGVFPAGLFLRDESRLPEEEVQYQREIENLSIFIDDPHLGWNTVKGYISNTLESTKHKFLYGDNYGKSFISNYVSVPSNLCKEISLLEDIGILMYTIYKSKNTIERYVAIVTFTKLRGMQLDFAETLWCIFLEHVVGKMIDSKEDEQTLWNKQVAEFHSQDQVLSGLKTAREYLDRWDTMAKSKLYTKLYKFGVYILASGLLDQTKINFKSCNFTAFEEKCARDTHRPGVAMFRCMLDTVLFVCERGYQYFQTGDMSTIFHSFR